MNRYGTDELLVEIAARLRTVAHDLPDSRWKEAYLDTVMHIVGATSGLLTDEIGTPVCAIGPDDPEDASRDVAQLPYMWPHDERGTAVLTWRHPSRRPEDLAGITRTLDSLLQ